jgi:hypothetical protein
MHTAGLCILAACANCLNQVSKRMGQLKFQMRWSRSLTPAPTPHHLPVHACAHSINFSALCIFISLWHLVVYCPIAHMVWHPAGILRVWGVLDFAGEPGIALQCEESHLPCFLCISSLCHLLQQQGQQHLLLQQVTKGSNKGSNTPTGTHCGIHNWGLGTAELPVHKPGCDMPVAAYQHRQHTL